MQSVSTEHRAQSTWQYAHGDFSKHLVGMPASVEINRQEDYRNISPECSIASARLLGCKDGGIKICLSMNIGKSSVALEKSFREDLPQVAYDHDSYMSFGDAIRIRISPGASFTANLNRSLEIINAFEAIEPLAVFVRMKKALGIDLAESKDVYTSQIQSLYRDEGNFDAALVLALQCKEAGYPGLVHGLAEYCIQRGDYMNAVKAISHETDLDSIYAFALDVFVSERVSGIASSGEKLQVALKLFDLCGSLHDAPRFKANIFCELAGKSFDRVFAQLAGDLHGDALCSVAQVLFMQNREIAKLKASSPSSDSVAVSASSGGWSGVVGGFAGGASSVSKTDAATQTEADDAAMLRK
jgi:hypothetical protein